MGASGMQDSMHSVSPDLSAPLISMAQSTGVRTGGGAGAVDPFKLTAVAWQLKPIHNVIW